MASAPTSEDFELLISYNSICERQRSALRLFAGRGKRFSVSDLSAASGVKDKRIEAAMRPIQADDYRLLRHEEVASIAKFLTGEGLGAVFVSALIEPCGLGAFELMGGQPPLPGVLANAGEPTSLEERLERIEREAALIRKEIAA